MSDPNSNPTPTTPQKNVGKKKKKEELISERRAYKLMEIVEEPTTADEVGKKYDFSSSDSDSSDSDDDGFEKTREEKEEAARKKKEEEAAQKPPRILVVKSVYGKTRPLTDAGKFSDRPKPTRPPPPNLIKNNTTKTKTTTPTSSEQTATMPFVYASNESKIMLTRGQYLDLAEAAAKKKQREIKRKEEEAEAKEFEQRWMCDTRMLPGWTVHYSKKHGKCYFVNTETKETLWKPPGKLVQRVATPPSQKNKSNNPNSPNSQDGSEDGGGGRYNHEGDVVIEPQWLRKSKACCSPLCDKLDSILPTPPRWLRKLKRLFQFGASTIGLGACCGPRRLQFEGACADDARDIVEALALSHSDIHTLYEAFREADWDNSGEMSPEELFAWLGEPLTRYSKSIFKLADMDDSGLIDFTEFVKISCFYSSFNEDDILKFGFDLFDDDKSGTIDEYELGKLIEQMNFTVDSDEPPDVGNIAQALEVIDKNGDGILDFGEFCALCRKLPLVLFPAFRLQKTLMAKTLGEERWSFILWNVNREKRVAGYMRSHHGRRPYGEFKATTRVLLEKFICCWPKLKRPFPDYVDGIRPAAGERPDGTFGGEAKKRPQVDTSEFSPPASNF